MKIKHGEEYAEQRVCFDAKEIGKLEQAAEVRGVVPICPTDVFLWRALDDYVVPPGWTAVKVVAHVTSGNQLAGILSPDASLLRILCVANYSHTI